MKTRVYRARIKGSSQWVYGYPCGNTGAYLVSENARVSSKDALEQKVSQIGVYEVEPDTWGQFTGKCDMDGNQIFEGDVVVKNKRYWAVGYSNNEMEFILYRNDGKADGPIISREKIKVVGNVFDNWDKLTGMTKDEAINGNYIPTQLRFAMKK